MVITVNAHKIAYMALPKAACTTVKAALAQVDADVETDLTTGQSGSFQQFHSIYPTMRFRPHRWKKYGEDWFRFCVVRDPLKRLISCYLNRVVELGELHNSRKIRDGRAILPVDPDPDFFFQNIAAYKEAASTIKHHTLPAWLFVGPNLSRYDRVYRTDELDWFADDLSERSGMSVTLTHENSSTTKLLLSDLASSTRAALAEHLAPEYEFLSAFYTSPFAQPRRRAVAAR